MTAGPSPNTSGGTGPGRPAVVTVSLRGGGSRPVSSGGVTARSPRGSDGGCRRPLARDGARGPSLVAWTRPPACLARHAGAEVLRERPFPSGSRFSRMLKPVPGRRRHNCPSSDPSGGHSPGTSAIPAQTTGRRSGARGATPEPGARGQAHGVSGVAPARGHIRISADRRGAPGPGVMDARGAPTLQGRCAGRWHGRDGLDDSLTVPARAVQ